jgi:L-lactate dehydrogenase
MVNNKKVGIVGCGFVGSSIAFSLMQSRLLTEMVLIDAVAKKAEGEAMDISHGLPYASPMDIHAGSYDELKDAAITIITAGASQKPGETRLDLVKKNTAILKSVLTELKKAKPEGLILIVSNPVDVLTAVAIQEMGLPRNRVFGSGTVLDTARFKYLLSRHLSVDARNVHGVIIGEHGDSELPVWSVTNVAGIPIHTFCEMRGYHDHQKDMDEIYRDVRDSAYQIIEKKGATYYGVAMAVTHIVSSILNDTKSMLPVSVLLNGEYGIHDVALSVPTLVGKDGAEQVLELPLSMDERVALTKSALELGNVLKEDGVDFSRK